MEIYLIIWSTGAQDVQTVTSIDSVEYYGNVPIAIIKLEDEAINKIKELN